MSALVPGGQGRAKAVIPAEAGIHPPAWIPASAGMTVRRAVAGMTVRGAFAGMAE